MRGSLVRRGKNRWALVIDLGYVTQPDGTRKRRQKWVSFSGRKREAGEKLTELARAQHRGEFVEPSKRTVAEWLTEWFEKCVKPTKRRRTVKMYDLIIKKVLVPAVGGIRLQQLKVADVQQFIANGIKDEFSPATIRMHLAVLSGALSQAVTETLVLRNVVSQAKDKPRVAKPEHRVKANTWTADEARRFLAEAAKHGPMVHAYYATALSTGARRSELAGLRWDAVDFDKGLIKIMQELDLPDAGGKVAFGPTKTDTTRLVNIGDDVVKLLRVHRKRQNEIKMQCGRRENYEDHGLVFCREYEHITEKWHKLGQPVYADGRGPGRLERLITLSGVKRISPHGLRDTCASLLANEGVPVKVISERLGHARSEMTLSRYIAVLPGAQESAGKQLNALLHG